MPYRWVRNPIYISALLVVLGQAWLLPSLPLLVYLAGLCIGFHLFVVGYEEPTLRRSFGETYDAYLRTVPRWFPRYPRARSAPTSRTGPPDNSVEPFQDAARPRSRTSRPLGGSPPLGHCCPTIGRKAGFLLDNICPTPSNGCWGGPE